MLYTIKYIERKILSRIVYPKNARIHDRRIFTTKLVKLLFVVIFALFATGNAFAIEKESFTEDNTESFYSQPIYYDDESCLTLLLESELDEENNEYVAFDDLIFEEKNNDDRLILKSFTLSSGLKNYKNKQFTWEYKLTYVGPKPIPTAKAILTLEANYEDGSGEYEPVATTTQDYTYSSQYGKLYTFVSTAQTGYYRIKADIIVPNNISLGKLSTKNKVLLNRTGHEWDFSFTDDGKTLTKPRAD